MNMAKFLESCRIFYSGERETLFQYSALGRWTEVTYDRFVGDVKKLCNYYQTQYETRSRIALVSENSYQYMVHMTALCCSGNVAVPVNQTYPAQRITEFIRIADVTGIVCEAGLERDIMSAIPEKRCITMDEADEAAAGCGADGKWDAPGESDVILMLFSSGTSGKSKAVPITNKNLFAFLEYSRKEYEKARAGQPQKKVLLLTPFYHIGGVVAPLFSIAEGRRIQISDAKHMTDDIQSDYFDCVIAVPAMIKRILSAGEASETFLEHIDCLSHIRCFGAPLDGQLVRKLRDHGITPMNYYGLTETTGVVAAKGDYREGSCGMVYPYCRVKIVDGEIAVSGDNVMKEYYNNPEETEKVFRDGWFYTGDLGEFDEDGYLYVKGRRKNIIILSNGENVCPEELEELLYRCPLVRECRVYEEGGSICAEVYPGTEQSGQMCEAEIKNHVDQVNRTLPVTHKIKKIAIAGSELKKNSAGKLLR